MIDLSQFASAAQQLVEAGKFLYSQGWSPATSSNYSLRLNEENVAITVSGKHKGQLKISDIMMVNMAGCPVQSTLTPSAETLLHTTLYEHFPKVGAVLHTHSMSATLVSRLLKGASFLSFSDYELQKAFEGQTTHEGTVVLPIFENTQDIANLSEQVLAYLAEHDDCNGYLIRGHGLYTWASDMSACLRHIEAFEFLLNCELTLLKIKQ